MAALREPNFFLNELELNRIEKDTKYTIYGYIRKAQNDDNISQIIPKLITLIILAFYVDPPDEFNPELCGKLIKISNDNTTITKHSGSTNTVYGKKVIPSTSIGTYMWKIKLLSGTGGMNIGIDNAEGTHCNGNIFVTRNKVYAYCANDGYFFGWKESRDVDSRHSLKFNKVNDILTMTLKLTLNGGKLIYKINDGKEFMFFDDILVQNNLKYRLAISIYDTNGSIQLIS